MKLVIIEGPGKRDTLKKYLGEGYNVVASKGHVRDLPKNSFGINLSTFEPIYDILPDKKQVEKELKQLASKADEVLIATDPDREGEAISWHIAHILNISEDTKCRIVFNEISKEAVQNALKHPREIDMQLVNAQQARRVLDRLVGYKLSPILAKKIRSKLSAGRVQSVALKLVVDREDEIKNFKPEEYWNISAVLSKDEKQKFKANLSHIHGKKAKVVSKEQADAVESAVKQGEWIVTNIKRAKSKSHAPAPFITSTMQQDASNKLGMNLSRTSSAAQQLYEGVDLPGEGKVALVTYIRTDSTRVAENAQAQAKQYIQKVFGKEYAPAKFNIYSSKKNAQDAHEAIRPINLERTPDSLQGKMPVDAFKLYKLIYERFLASQMAEAVFDSVTVEIENNHHTFKAVGKTPVFLGYLAIYQNYEESNENDEKDPKIPQLDERDNLISHEFKKEQKFTKPASRYTEASLVKAMEEKGIGRPATYAPTISTLANREYTTKEGKYLVPTELGDVVTKYLEEHFDRYINVEFTARMEAKLDEIAEGEKDWKQWIAAFWEGFAKYLEKADEFSSSLKAPPVETDEKCEKCGSTMLLREGRYGKFLACSAFPKCKHTVKLGQNTEAKEKPEPVFSDVSCDKCGAKMLIKQGRYGEYLACSGYPKCKNIQKPAQTKTEKVKKEPVLSDKLCSKCGKPMAVKSGRYGSFLACTGYPSCKNIEKLKGENETKQ